MDMNETDLKAISIIERELKNGKTIYESYCVVAKVLNMPIHKCNNRYHTKWRFNLSNEVKMIIDSRKTEKQKAYTKPSKINMSIIEKETRELAKKKFIKLRNVDTGVTAYLPNGVDKIRMVSWEDVYHFISNFNYEYAIN